MAASERDELAEVLAAHLWHHTKATHCSCGWRSPLAQLAIDGYLTHVADALADLLAQRDRRVAAEALREAAEEAVGMGQGQTRQWLRERADRIERGE